MVKKNETFFIISICLSLFFSNSFLITQVHGFDYQFRIVRGHFFIQEAEKIFYEVAEEQGAPSVITPSYSKQIRLYARFLEFSQPTRDSDFERILKNTIKEQIEFELALLNHSVSIGEFYARPDSLHSIVDSTLNQVYQILIEFRDQLSELGISIDLPNYKDFIEVFFFMEDIEAIKEIHRKTAGTYLPIFDKILLNPYIFNQPSYAISAVLHEKIHTLFPGFVIPILDEGMATLITKKLTNDERPMYEAELTIVKQIQDIVGKEALLRAYATGSYEPLRGKLDGRIINIFKQIELVQRFDGYDDLYLKFIDFFIEAHS